MNLFVPMVEITTNIDNEANLRKHTVTGILTLNDVLTKLNEIYSMPDFQPDMNVLWDLRNADTSKFDSSQVNTVSDFVSRHWGKGSKNRAALVATRDVDFGLSRMYQMMLETKTSNEVRIFRDYDKALRWVKS